MIGISGISGMSWSLAPLVFATLATTPAPPGSIQAVHTATRDVHGCARFESGYAAATEGGLVLLDEGGDVFGPALSELDGLPATRVYTVEPTADADSSALWVGTEGGLARVEVDERAAAGARVVTTHASAPVRAIAEHEGHTYVGTWGEGILELQGGRLVPVPVSAAADGGASAQAQRITDLLVHGGELVAASAGAGAWRVIDDARVPLDGGPTDALLWSLASHGGDLYAGTLIGVARLDGPRSRTFGSRDARALASVDGELVVAGARGGLSTLAQGPSTFGPGELAAVRELDPQGCIATADGLWLAPGEKPGEWRRSLDEGLPSGDVTDVLPADGRVYVSTFDRGVHVLEGSRWRSLEPADSPNAPVIDPQVNALASAGPERLWIATARGLFRAEASAHAQAVPERWTKKRGLPHDNVLSLLPLDGGELLVGTHAGPVLVDEAGEVRPLGSRARRWAVWAVAAGEVEGEYWLGTTQGLIHWLPNGRWIHLSMLSGHLSDNWVTSLVWSDEGELYVGTYAGGVDRLSPGDEGRGTWRAQALGGGRVNPGGLSVLDGTIYAATMKGALAWTGERWRAHGEGTATVFEDVTAVIADGERTWVASRRGLVASSP